jgi:hypothetical protein
VEKGVIQRVIVIFRVTRVSCHVRQVVLRSILLDATAYVKKVCFQTRDFHFHRLIALVHKLFFTEGILEKNSYVGC